MTNVRELVMKELEGVKTIAEAQASIERVATKTGNRMPTVTEVLAGQAIVFDKVLGLDKETQMLLARTTGKVIRLVMEENDAKAEAASKVHTATPGEVSWDVIS